MLAGGGEFRLPDKDELDAFLTQGIDDVDFSSTFGYGVCG
jgi:hypothetical protein